SPAAPAGATSSVSVFVGYADNLRADPANFPTPFGDDAGVVYEGCEPVASCTFDASAARVVNNSSNAITIDSVTIQFTAGCLYDIWPHNVSLPAGESLILTQTTNNASSGCQPGIGSIDGSDIGPNGSDWSSNCNQSGVIPEIDVTIAGQTTAYMDTGQ